MSEQKPRAWLQEPKVQPIAGRHFVRGVRTVEPTAEEYEFCELDGDVLLPLYDAAALAAAVAAERERCAKINHARADKMKKRAEESANAGEHDEVTHLHATAWQLTVAEHEMLKGAP